MQKMKVTIEDIAHRAGVSISTVSRVFNKGALVTETKRTAVLKAAKELNYQPNIFARGLASGQSRTIGVMTQNVGGLLYDTILRNILQVFSGSGYSPIFADGAWDPAQEKKALDSLLARRIDGLIALGGGTPVETFQEIAAQIPLLITGRYLPALADRCLGIDNFRGGYKATRFLIERGYKRIAHITGILTHEDANHRQEGYYKAIQEAGIDVDPDLIVEGDFLEQSGVMGVEMLLSRRRTFTAVFAANDQMAYGVILGLSRHGLRVPEDVSVVGFDDLTTSAYITPPLTTIRQPAIEMGEAVARGMLRLLNGQQPDLPPLPTELIVRESVGRYR